MVARSRRQARPGVISKLEPGFRRTRNIKLFYFPEYFPLLCIYTGLHPHFSQDLLVDDLTMANIPQIHTNLKDMY